MTIAVRFRCIVILAGIAAISVGAFSQQPKDPEKGAPPMKLSPGVAGYLQKSAYALGSWRRVSGGARPFFGVNGVYFIANGTMSEAQPGGAWVDYKVPSVTVEMTFYNFQQGVLSSPGYRWDYTLTDSNGKKQRKILAAAAGSSWNEETPGGKATPVPNAAAYRLLHNSLSPHGLLWAAFTPDGKGVVEGVKMSEEGGKTIVTIPINGVPAKVTMNSDLRPEKVETRVKHPVLGDTTIEFDYLNYKDIEVGYGIFFPEHFIEKVGGRTVVDLTVTEFHTNAYSIFPVPGNVQRAAN